MKTRYPRLKALISYVVSVCLVLTGTLPITATAQSARCTSSADTGAESKCAAVRIAGSVVSYPKLDWQFISELPSPAVIDAAASLVGTAINSTGNRSADALGVGPSELARMVSTFPSNMPYVLGRYNPLDATLRVDVFKLERTSANGQVKAGLYQAQFGPGHGDMWKAARSYLHPDDFKAGLIPGVNPFAAFKQSGDDNFHSISLSAAQVAVGHAMRATGTPFAMLVVAQPRISQKTTKSGGWLKKTTRTWIYGHAKPQWFVAQSAATLSRSSTQAVASFCATDPAQTTCPAYGTAVSGVSFEEFEGGTFDGTEQMWELDYFQKSGLGFLAMLIIAVVASYAMMGLMTAAMGSAAAGAGAGAAAGAGAGAAGAGAAAGASGAMMGSWGSLMVQGGLIGGAGTIGGAIAIEAAVIAGGMVLGGANLGSTFDASLQNLLFASPVAKGTMDAPNLSAYEGKLNLELGPRSTGDLAKEPALSAVTSTVLGGCTLGSMARDCAGSTDGAGVISRPDEFREQNGVQFMQDTGGRLIRSR